MKAARGFTLLETLVALLIVAVALVSSLTALGRTADAAAGLREQALATWVAQNRLAENRARQTWPAIGSTQGRVEQAREVFVWRQVVGATPNPFFRRVDVEVYDASGQRLASLTGFATRAPQ